MPQVLFNNREPITGKIRKPVSVERYKKLREKGRLIPKLEQQAMLAKQRAEYLASPKGLVKETIKGIPEATKKVGKKILEYSPAGLVGRALKGGRYGEKEEERIKKTPEGTKLLESIKGKGIWETYKSLRKNK